MTYQNGQQARRDLLDFGAAPFLACIDQTLSGPNVTPAGIAVRLDRSVWLDEPVGDPLVPTTTPTGEVIP
jgi:hypothetical protein